MQITIPYTGLAPMILSEAAITSDAGESLIVSALWDTGATGCMISENVAQKLNLKKSGELDYYHAGGASTAAIYEVAIEIKGVLNMGWVKIAAMDAAPHFDMLIGMDVITRGDFRIRNDNGNTLFTFAC